MTFDPKGPADLLDYMIDWSTWIGDDTIAESDWDIDDGIKEESSEFTDTTATIWLSGGTAKVRYYLTNQIVTAAGRKKHKTVSLLVT